MVAAYLADPLVYNGKMSARLAAHDPATPYWPSSPHNPDGYQQGFNNERAGDNVSTERFADRKVRRVMQRPRSSEPHNPTLIRVEAREGLTACEEGQRLGKEGHVRRDETADGGVDKRSLRPVESPNGELGFYVVSDGTGKKYKTSGAQTLTSAGRSKTGDLTKVIDIVRDTSDGLDTTSAELGSTPFSSAR